MEGVLLRASINFDAVELRGCYPDGSVKLRAVHRQNIAAPGVAIIVANHLDIAGQKTNLASRIEIIEVCYCGGVLTIVVELGGLVDSELTCGLIVRRDCSVLGVSPLMIGWCEVELVAYSPVESWFDQGLSCALLDRNL